MDRHIVVPMVTVTDTPDHRPAVIPGTADLDIPVPMEAEGRVIDPAAIDPERELGTFSERILRLKWYT